jgi:hypothetical protein
LLDFYGNVSRAGFKKKFRQPGTDVTIFEMISPKNYRKKLAFFVQNTAILRKIFIAN